MPETLVFSVALTSAPVHFNAYIYLQRYTGMGEDLQLTGNRFNIGLSCFYVPYILLEV
jgi:hypothetical protein